MNCNQGVPAGRPDSRDPAGRVARSTERGSAGLPVAVQVIGRPWRENLVLATIAAIERGGHETPGRSRSLLSIPCGAFALTGRADRSRT